MEQIRHPRNFPSIAEYESSPELKEKREFLLTSISALQDVLNDLNAETPEIDIPKLKELNTLSVRLQDMDVTPEYLDTFMEEGKLLPGRKFTEAARHNPEVMTEWIAHDLLGIMKRLFQTIIEVGGFDRFNKLGDAPDNLNHSDLARRLADSVIGKQGALSFFLTVLDAETY